MGGLKDQSNGQILRDQIKNNDGDGLFLYDFCEIEQRYVTSLLVY